jgi:hypothetical protein
MAELARLAPKEVLAERFLIEKRNLERSLEALRSAAAHDGHARCFIQAVRVGGVL